MLMLLMLVLVEVKRKGREKEMNVPGSENDHRKDQIFNHAIKKKGEQEDDPKRMNEGSSLLLSFKMVWMGVWCLLREWDERRRRSHEG